MFLRIVLLGLICCCSEYTIAMKTQIRQIEPEYKKLKRNYLIYVVRTCTFSTISLLGFIGIGYFGWVFHHCSEKG